MVSLSIPNATHLSTIDIGISIDTGMCRGCGGGVGAHGCFLLSESKSWLFAQHNLPNTLL